VRASPKTARAANPLRSRASRGASVATMIMHEPSAESPPLGRAPMARRRSGPAVCPRARRRSTTRRQSSSARARRAHNATRPRAPCASRADALSTRSTGYRSRATAPSSTGPPRAPRWRQHVLCRDVLPPDVVQAAVVRFPDDRIHRAHVALPGCASVQAAAAATATPTLSVLVSRTGVSIVPSSSTCVEPRELAEGVADEHGTRHLLLEQVARVRNHGCDTRAHAVAVDDRGMPDGERRQTSVIALSGPEGTRPVRYRDHVLLGAPPARALGIKMTAASSAAAAARIPSPEFRSRVPPSRPPPHAQQPRSRCQRGRR